MGCAASTPNDRPPARARAEEPAPPAPAPAPPAPQLQSQEVLQDALAAVAARDGEVCALVAVTDAAALKAAYVASVAGGGPLAGVLCVLKDNIGAAGTATAASTPALLESNHAPPSAAVWTRLEAAGAVLLGKVGARARGGAGGGWLGQVAAFGLAGGEETPQRRARRCGRPAGAARRWYDASRRLKACCAASPAAPRKAHL